MTKLASKYPFIRTCHVWRNGKMTAYRLGNKYNRMLYLLKKPLDKIYFKIEYGPAKNRKGKMEVFYNDGVYTDMKEALKAYRAFME
jgi:hypothetical protein